MEMRVRYYMYTSVERNRARRVINNAVVNTAFAIGDDMTH